VDCTSTAAKLANDIELSTAAAIRVFTFFMIFTFRQMNLEVVS